MSAGYRVPDEHLPRVFFPGDELPVGVMVMARDGSTEVVRFPGTTVAPHQPNPLVEVPMPDFERAVRVAWGRRWARQEVVS
jgi:hypothetical protein